MRSPGRQWNCQIFRINPAVSCGGLTASRRAFIDRAAPVARISEVALDGVTALLGRFLPTDSSPFIARAVGGFFCARI